ncbi:MAG: BpuSI family type II restriction endonuclease [Alphaproteobacteria bacterium]|nr:BpuSI family type II restriction endonuclease [Alphaproteobacteria bacterium]
MNEFHPICKEALNRALHSLNLSDTYEVVHHLMIGSLEADFTIRNKNTGKIFSIIEVKRTPQDVNSARYQIQAESYVKESAKNLEAPYYFVTNLECLIPFKYDPARPRIFQQILEPGLIQIGKLSDRDLVEKLTGVFVDRFSRIINNTARPFITLDNFAEIMEQSKDNPRLWKSNLAVLLYEYIRGSLSSIGRNELSDIRLLKGDIRQICETASRVNFHSIFDYNADLYAEEANLDAHLLGELFKLGKQNISGDAIADTLHQIVSAGCEHSDGEVATDLELANVVAVLAKSLLPNVPSEGKVCDPAAGSGSLLASAANIFNITPKQIKANDIKSSLGELLSLRLGLTYPQTINRDNCPEVSSKNLSELAQTYFSDVKVIVLNPPFVRGIDCIGKKNILSDRIVDILGESSTNIGQMGLEGVFLELLLANLADGTVISCILPTTCLSATGQEAVALRKLLLEKFGLRMIFTYPRESLFDEVTKSTFVCVGIKGMQADHIKIISSNCKIADIDIDEFLGAVTNGINSNIFVDIMPGVEAKFVAANILAETTDTGWRSADSTNEKLELFIGNLSRQNLLSPLDTLGYDIRRGTAGNAGLSDLIFLNPALFKDHLPTLPTVKGLRNVPESLGLYTVGDNVCADLDKLSKADVSSLVKFYLDNQKVNPNAKQLKKEKTSDESIDILKREYSNMFSGKLVLLPRATRRYGQVSFTDQPMLVSTNLVVLSANNIVVAQILSSWFSSIFGQLQMEYFSKNQEGLRKIEVADMLKMLTPDMNKLGKADIKSLLSEMPNVQNIDLQNVQIRAIDTIWAKILLGNESEVVLRSATQLLQQVANKRAS